ncbi:MAG: hypothetical protein U0325_31290 [Polyangiales bacterium]
MKRWLLPLTPILSLALLDCGGSIDDGQCGSGLLVQRRPAPHRQR